MGSVSTWVQARWVCVQCTRVFHSIPGVLESWGTDSGSVLDSEDSWFSPEIVGKVLTFQGLRRECYPTTRF